MPDLLVHILLPWLGLKLVQAIMGKPNDRTIVLVLVGAVLPDVVSINYVTESLGHDVSNIVLPLHTPVGSILFAAVLSLFFTQSSKAFKWMVVGSFTHFALDSLIVHAAGGMVLLFPVAWVWDFQMGVLRSTDWGLPLAVVALFLVFLIWRRMGSPSRKT